MRLEGNNLHKGLAVFLEDGECSVNVCHYYSVLWGVLCPREGGRQSWKPPSLCHQSLPSSGLGIHSRTLSQPSQIPAPGMGRRVESWWQGVVRVHPDRAAHVHTHTHRRSAKSLKYQNHQTQNTVQPCLKK